MIRSRLRGWGLAAIALCAAPVVRAQQAPTAPAAHPSHDAAAAPATTASGRAGKGAGDATTRDHPAPVATAPAADAASFAPAVPEPRPPDPTEGDRTALINQDVAQHPPQTEIASRDPSHLQTAKMRLGSLLDRSVHSLENSEVGRVIDVMTGSDGKPAALELDVGGFMGVGNRRIAVAWSLFDLSRTGQNDPLRVALSAAQVRSAPAMDDAGETPVVTGATPITAPPSGAATGATSPAPAVAGPPPLATSLSPSKPPQPAGAAPSQPAPQEPNGKPQPHPADSAATPSPTGPARAGDHGATVPPRSHDEEERF